MKCKIMKWLFDKKYEWKKKNKIILNINLNSMLFNFRNDIACIAKI